MSRAWDQAYEAAAVAQVVLRPLTSVEDAHAINGVIQMTWGGQELDHEVIRALAVSGNVPWGAEVDGRLVGFVLGWAGIDHDGLHVHSHMLASIPDRRHAGVGFALKLAQRAQALDQGIEVMRWTFDPLIARNAWFNLGKLGVVCDRFERGFYGEMHDDINEGERSDRFVVRWDLPRDPGRASIGADHVILERVGPAERPEPKRCADPAGDVAVIMVPAEYQELRATDPAAAHAWRDASADAFEACFAAGLVGAGFWREISAYVFVRPGRAMQAYSELGGILR